MNFDLSKVNVGKTDRLIRAIVGLFLILAALRNDSWLFGLIGLVLLGTAYLRYCPAYTAFDIKTNKDEAPGGK
jgi:hypothetical protein